MTEAIYQLETIDEIPIILLGVSADITFRGKEMGRWYGSGSHGQFGGLGPALGGQHFRADIVFAYIVEVICKNEPVA